MNPKMQKTVQSLVFKCKKGKNDVCMLNGLGLTPHPPAYFRIAQLESLKEPEKIKHMFLKSIKDALKGFLRA